MSDAEEPQIAEPHAQGTHAGEPPIGRITSLKAQVEAQGRVSIFVDGQFAFGVNRDVVLEFGLKKGFKLTEQVQRAILERENHFRARFTALNFLSYRDRSEHEMRVRLQKSKHSESAIESTIDYLKSSRLLNDASFAITYAEGRFRSGGYGPVRVRHDLRKKGIDDASIEQAIEEVYSEVEDLMTTARDLGRRRWEKLSREKDDRKRRKKVYDHLARRGFPYAVVRTILDELS